MRRAGGTRPGGEYISGAVAGSAWVWLPRSVGAKREKKLGAHSADQSAARFERTACVAIGPAYTGRRTPGPGLVSHETHLPAEKAQARPHARLPRPDAHARRAPDAEAPARQGSQAADGLMVGVPGARPPSRAREAVAQRRLRPRVPPRALSRGPRARAVRVPARRGRARRGSACRCRERSAARCERNRVKRLLREAFALEGERLPAGTDAVVVARHEAKALAEREGLAGIRRVLERIGRPRG